MPTATADPATIADLGLDLGPDEQFACGHPCHATATQSTRVHSHDSGPGVYWAVTTHPCFGPVGVRYPICERYGSDWLARPDSAGSFCAWCAATLEAGALKVIGRIS